MSTNVREALEDGAIYLQSPIDDLESFYHVFVWAILYNEWSQESLVDEERKYRDMLSGSWAARDFAERRLVLIVSPSAIVSQLEGLIKAWDKTQDEFQNKRVGIERIFRHLVAKGSIGQGGITEQAFRKWAWNLIAFEGVQRILDVIYGHKEDLVKYSSFSQA